MNLRNCNLAALMAPNFVNSTWGKASRFLAVFIPFLAIVLLPSRSCTADVRTWDAGGDGVSWEDRCNWSGNEGFPACLGQQPLGGDDAVIPSGHAVRSAVLFDVPSLSVGPPALLDIHGNLGTFAGVTNEGRITITGGLGIGEFNASNTLLQGGGEVVLANSNVINPARLNGASYVSSHVTHAAGSTIRGEGVFAGKWINDGLIRAEETSGDALATLYVSGTMTNNGTVRSSATGSLLLDSAALTMGAAGQLIADTQPIELGAATTIYGGSIDAINGGKFVRRDAGGTAVFSGVTINGDFDVLVTNAGIAGTGTGITNNGTLTLDNLGVANGQFHMDAGSTLDGTGQVILNRANDSVHMSGSFTHGANHTIRGAGRIHANIVNDGSIVAEPKVGGGLLRIQFNAITNNNRLEANRDATLRLEQVAVTQGASGRIYAVDGGRVELSGFATVFGGKLQTEGTGLIVDVNESVLNGVTNEGEFHVLTGSKTRINTTLINNGTITVNPSGAVGGTGIEFSSDAVLSGTGTIVLNQIMNSAFISSAESDQDITQEAGHTIRGGGRISSGYFGDGRFINHGRLEGNSAAEPLVIQAKLSGSGTLKDVQIGGDGFGITHTLGEEGTTSIVPAEGSYNFVSLNRMLIDLAGTTPGTGYDQLNSTGPITLSDAATRLEVSILDGFVPSPGDQFKVVTTTDRITGTFGSSILPTNIPNYALTWKPVQYSGQDIVLEILSVSPMLGDFDGNGLLTVLDLELLASEIHTAGAIRLFDVTGDSLVDNQDQVKWIRELRRTYFGDANLDGEFNSTDLIEVFQAGQYEDTVVGASTWSTGDWDADGDFTTSDLVLAFQDGGYETGPRAVVSVVPEPTGLLLLLIGLCGVPRLSRIHGKSAR